MQDGLTQTATSQVCWHLALSVEFIMMTCRSRGLQSRPAPKTGISEPKDPVRKDCWKAEQRPYLTREGTPGDAVQEFPLERYAQTGERMAPTLDLRYWKTTCSFLWKTLLFGTSNVCTYQY